MSKVFGTRGNPELALKYSQKNRPNIKNEAYDQSIRISKDSVPFFPKKKTRKTWINTRSNRMTYVSLGWFLFLALKFAFLLGWPSDRTEVWKMVTRKYSEGVLAAEPKVVGWSKWNRKRLRCPGTYEGTYALVRARWFLDRKKGFSFLRSSGEPGSHVKEISCQASLNCLPYMAFIKGY